MTESQYESLTKAERRRIVARALLRPALTSSCLVLLYFTLPIGERVSVKTVLLLAAGLLAVGVLIGFQTRAIARSPYPRLQAIEAFALAVPLYLLLFSAAYVVMAAYRPAAFSQHLSRFDSLYFTVTVFSSVGFGDIVPRSEPARFVTTIQMLGNLLLLGVAVRIILEAVQVGLRRRGEGGPERP
ncbi:potassium channel family protein [Streptacidiphilus anmyonensis]|uniref:potassium channel family protein n=1 Tax=Streptacidiphilus anmyonensis TaxID=405782 RepID=UPI0005AAAB79|nr:potassium channel family protein [Streptacidiphilus anmyonensis]